MLRRIRPWPTTRLSVWTSSSLDTLGELHDTTGQIISNNDDGDGNNFRMETTILPGRYWVRVVGNVSSTGAYQLHRSFVPAGPSFVIKSLRTPNGGSGWALTAATAVGYNYMVQKNTSLDGAWTQVGPVITANAQETRRNDHHCRLPGDY